MPANIDIFSTHYLLAAVREMTPLTTFLRDRYFPTNPATDLFATDDVLVEYKDGNRKIAPFVMPRKHGVTIEREGYTMQRFTPPLVAPRRTLTIDDLSRRGFGEALLTNLTPEQRQSVMMMGDLNELGQLITRREEAMAAEILTTNKCVMKHYADDLSTVVDEKVIQFYEGGSNPAEYTASGDWDESGAKIMDDIWAMIKLLAARGLPATDLLVAPDVAAVMINDPTIKSFLDIKRYELGEVNPVETMAGVSRICVLNVYGRLINVFCYSETYEAEDGTATQYIPDGYVVLTAPGAGRTLYGAITQLEQADGAFHTYAGSRIPKYLSDAQNNVRTLTLSSAPLLIPNNKTPWIFSKVMD